MQIRVNRSYNHYISHGKNNIKLLIISSLSDRLIVMMKMMLKMIMMVMVDNMVMMMMT